MRDRSGRVRAPWSSISHVPEFLSSSEEQQHQLDALVAGLDRETLQKTDEPPELQSGESTTHGKAFPAIDDPDPDPPSSAYRYLLDGLPSCHNSCVTCDACGASTWTWNGAPPSCGGVLTRATSYESLDINHGLRERKPPARRKTMHVWECCQCGRGNINIQLEQCPDCGVYRCAYCKTTRVQVRGH
ncbi:hypothetical protein F5882DRAFT_164510 [Hyaloscypha sp. PMI_1271]|nr:hypothetical protein F5882DRAFT_164510 [Hyaloscypha sp. PMI_1271]